MSISNEQAKAKVLPLLSPEKMRQVHHTFQTQKNETLQRKTMAYLPKDSFFGGTMQLHDRIRLVVILDSLGEYTGLQRLFFNVGLPPLHVPMGFWAHRKDNDDGHASVRRAKPEVKAKRAQKNVDKMKSQAMKDKAAAKKGITYESGIGNKTDAAVVGKKGTAGTKRKR